MYRLSCLTLNLQGNFLFVFIIKSTKCWKIYILEKRVIKKCKDLERSDSFQTRAINFLNSYFITWTSANWNHLSFHGNSTFCEPISQPWLVEMVRMHFVLMDSSWVCSGHIIFLLYILHVPSSSSSLFFNQM